MPFEGKTPGHVQVMSLHLRGRKRRGDRTAWDKMTRCLHLLTMLLVLLKPFFWALWSPRGRWVDHGYGNQGREAVWLAHGSKTSQE